MQGKLVVLEGVEGCGKTSQIQAIAAWLEAHPLMAQARAQGKISQVVTTREPGGTALCQEIRQLLLHPQSLEAMQPCTELLLYAADRSQHVETLLKPKLAERALILCDRFTDSTMAYQGYGRGLDRQLIDQLNQIATAGLQSDLTLWLDVAVEVGLSRAKRRGAADRMEQATLAFHRRVQQGFGELARLHDQRIVRVDASRSLADVSQAIQAILEQYLQQWYGR